MRVETVPDKEKNIKQPTEKSRKRGITQIMTRDNVELKKEMIQANTQQPKIQTENAELIKETTTSTTIKQGNQQKRNTRKI